MLIKLTSDQIADYWEVIAPTIEQTIVPFVPDIEKTLTNVLASLLSESMDCWFISKDASGTKISGVITTSLSFDFISGTANLLIYSLYTVRPLDRKILVDIYNTLSKYAKHRGASQIIAYTDNGALVDLINSVSFGKATQVFMSIGVDGNEEELKKIGGV